MAQASCRIRLRNYACEGTAVANASEHLERPGKRQADPSSCYWETVMEDQKEQDRIRRRAYEIWEREGSPDGRAEEFWEQAKTSLEEEDAQGTVVTPAVASEGAAVSSAAK